jgi:hypothetical protein
MFLIFHVIVALTSIVYASYVFISPSEKKLYGSYFLTALTLGSGSYLVFKNPAHMTQACITGVIYLGFVVLVTISARHKLASHK